MLFAAFSDAQFLWTQNALLLLFYPCFLYERQPERPIKNASMRKRFFIEGRDYLLLRRAAKSRAVMPNIAAICADSGIITPLMSAYAPFSV